MGQWDDWSRNWHTSPCSQVSKLKPMHEFIHTHFFIYLSCEFVTMLTSLFINLYFLFRLKYTGLCVTLVFQGLMFSIFVHEVFNLSQIGSISYSLLNHLRTYLWNTFITPWYLNFGFVVSLDPEVSILALFWWLGSRGDENLITRKPLPSYQITDYSSV